MDSALRTTIPSRYLPLGLLLLCSCGPLVGLHPSKSYAGLTASEVVVVVNGDSSDSRTLANHFVSLRGIPAVNVIVLEQIPNSETISVEDFRSKILRPVLAELAGRQLSGHVQCITYSADFPTAIDISTDLEKIENRLPYMTPRGSINGLTYLYLQVSQGNPFYVDPNSNFYARRSLDVYLTNPAGSQTAEVWAKIQKQVAAGAHADASRELEKLHQQHPHQFPILYLAAAEAALASEEDRAVKLLRSSINLGWNAGGYMANDERLDSLRENPEFQILELLVDDSIIEFQPSAAFDARTYWTPNGIPISAPNATGMKLGLRYMLSTVLGVTRGNGTTLNQAIETLERSASADFTHPQGGFYFCVTNDVRSQARQWSFLDAVDSLKAMGFEAELVTNAIPKNKPAVLGVQSGVANFSWAASRSKFVPGAIADNFTSYGGIMTPGASQTKLTEYILAGAAGSSGTVTEPLALHQKFPLPQLYVHYARGASLVESFYMSVAGPYQLLIVGDPLCRPFSNAPIQKFGDSTRFLDENAVLQLKIDLSGPTHQDWLESAANRAKQTEPFAPSAVSVLIDGVKPQTRPVQPNLNLNLKGLTGGFHEIILRFATGDPIIQKHESRIPLWIGDREAISLSFPEATQQAGDPARHTVSAGADKITVSVSAANAKRISLWHDREQLATASGAQAEFSVTPSNLGNGPVRLQARAELENGQAIHSLPHWLDVQP